MMVRVTLLPRRRHTAVRRLLAALIGVLAAGVSVGVGELVAAFVRPAASPVIVVGNRMILLTPEPVKRWAIRVFGTHDKTALLTGIYLTIALLAVVVGLLCLRRIEYGIAGIALFGGVAVYCALTTHAHRTSDVVPSVVGAVAGILALRMLVAAESGGHPQGTDLGTVEPPAAERGLESVAGRRRFLQVSGVAAGVGLVGGFGGRALQRSRYDASTARAAVTLPAASGTPAPVAAGFDFGKSGVPFQVTAARFYRIDTALSVPQINPATWKLRIHGMVARELTLTYEQLLAMPQVERWITLACVSNEIGGDLIGNATFQGVLLADILKQVGIAAEADQLIASSSDGMTIGSPTAVVMDGRDAMLAVGMNGDPLPIEHGFPVRMVVPGLYGYVSACKWIVDLKATTFGAQQAYWVRGGWAVRGPVKLESRIDTPRKSAVLTAGSTVAIAGVAWDQHVGVSKVEVQVDGEAWQETRLAPVPSTDTWRQWLVPWTVPAAGVHTVRVRATDARGVVQSEALADPFPSGATGLHTISVRSR
jgi:DMSO/TMAO reductase YedYZ molybdopterin-dependent catalytic subunit